VSRDYPSWRRPSAQDNSTLSQGGSIMHQKRSRSDIKRRRTAAKGSALLLLILASAATLSDQLPADAPRNSQDDIFPLRLDTTGLRVVPGSLEEAKAYYAELGNQLHFPGGRVPDHLDGLLEYFGYQTLRAADLDTIEPAILTNLPKLKAKLAPRLGDQPLTGEFAVADAAWDLLAAGYFSPKTSDVSCNSTAVSWRKVVRLKAIPGSAASSDRITALYFLSVIYAPASSNNPFAAPSKNIQTMIVRGNDRESKLKDPGAWIVYDPTKNYELTHYTATSWDAGDPAVTDKNGVRKYYVPTACMKCHGDSRDAAAPQFFDTDYILDRAADDDFASRLGSGSASALFDAGNDPTSNRFKKAFDIFRRLNREILDQSQFAAPGSVGLPSAKVWMRLHASSDEHFPPIKRAITDKEIPNLTEFWSDKSEVDRSLLPLLNRYCYRCHGTLNYNVYNKDDVLDRATKMVRRLQSKVLKERMPQDRDLVAQNPAAHAELIKWLNMLKP
jgi:hypothetical protein